MEIGPLNHEEFIRVACSKCEQFTGCNPIIITDEGYTFIRATVYRFQNRAINGKMYYECSYYTPSISTLLLDVIGYLKRIDAKLETMVSANGK